MNLFKVYFSIESKGLYCGYDEAKSVSNLSEEFDLFNDLTNDDTIYVDVLKTGDSLIISGEKGDGFFIEIDTAKGGIFSKIMTREEMKVFLNDLRLNFDELDIQGFDSSSV